MASRCRSRNECPWCGTPRARSEGLCCVRQIIGLGVSSIFEEKRLALDNSNFTLNCILRSPSLLLPTDLSWKKMRANSSFPPPWDAPELAWRFWRSETFTSIWKEIDIIQYWQTNFRSNAGIIEWFLTYMHELNLIFHFGSRLRWLAGGSEHWVPRWCSGTNWKGQCCFQTVDWLGSDCGRVTHPWSGKSDPRGLQALSADATNAEIGTIAEEVVNLALGMAPSATHSTTPLPMSMSKTEVENPKHVKGGLSRHILVHNMFDKDEETEENWADDVKLEFEEEGGKYGKISLVKVWKRNLEAKFMHHLSHSKRWELGWSLVW